nr:hypothetical protein [Tanacetum cinerariifolium]
MHERPRKKRLDIQQKMMTMYFLGCVELYITTSVGKLDTTRQDAQRKKDQNLLICGQKEEYARELDHEEEHKAQDKGMPEDVAAGKQPMTKDVVVGKQPMIEDEPLQEIRHPTEDDDHVLLRVCRVIHYHKCWETGHNKTRCPKEERPKPAYLWSKGIVFQEALSSSMPPFTLNTMPPPPTPSSLNIMSPPPTPSPSTSNTMPPPSCSNTMPPPLTPSGSKTMPSHAAPSSNTSAGSNTMPSASTRGGSRGGATNRDGSRGGASKRGRGLRKRGCGSNTMPFQGLRDEASDKEEYARELDHEEEYKAQDKGMPEDVAAGKQPMTKDVVVRKQPMIEDEPLQGGADLPI